MGKLAVALSKILTITLLWLVLNSPRFPTLSTKVLAIRPGSSPSSTRTATSTYGVCIMYILTGTQHLSLTSVVMVVYMILMVHRAARPPPAWTTHSRSFPSRLLLSPQPCKSIYCFSLCRNLRRCKYSSCHKIVMSSNDVQACTCSGLPDSCSVIS